MFLFVVMANDVVSVYMCACVSSVKRLVNKHIIQNTEYIYIYRKTKGKQIVQRAQQLTSGNVNGGKKAVKV